MAPLPSSSSSKSFRHSSRRIRAPLQDLPLDQFLLPPPMSTTLAKRPISPGTPVLYSPAKRRILNEEGLFAAKSPLSASAIPSSSKQPSTVPQHHPHSTTRFADAFVGPDSPARKLDFGMPKNTAGCRTPMRETVVEKLVTSPEIKAGSRSRPRSREADEDYFSISSQSQTQPPQPQSQPVLSSSQSQRYLDFSSVPRELPLPIDPQSDHYPGFVVHQDPYLLIPTLRLTSPVPPSASISVLAAFDNNVDDESDTESTDPRDLVKENLPPRRKARKATTPPTVEKAQLFSSPSAKSSSVPATPPRESSLRDGGTLTPGRPSIFGVGIGSGLGKAQHTPSKQDRRAMRRILEEEVDGEQGDE